MNNLPAVIKRQLTTAELPENYEKAKVALAECAKVDQCKEWINRMAAMASYARQSKDEALEHLAIRIRRRAERRLGELLAELPVPPRGSTQRNRRKDAAVAVGLNQPLAAQLVRISTVPKDAFERKVEASPPPTLRQLDPGWSASLSKRMTGDPDSMHLYSEVEEPVRTLLKLIHDRQLNARARAEEIVALGLPSEYIAGLKSGALIVSEWLDELAEYLK